MLQRYRIWRESRRIGDLLALGRSRDTLPIWLVLVLCLASTGLAAWVTHRSSAFALSKQFELATLRVTDELVRVMATYEHTLRAGAGLFNASTSVSAEQWGHFASGLDLDRTFPGIQGYGYAEMLPDSSGERGEAATAPAPTEAGHARTAIVYLEPSNWRNRRAIGFDMYAEPVRHAAMAAARDTGEPRLSRRVTLVQETSENTQPGVLMYMPVYRGEPGNLEERRQYITGWVYAAFRMTDLVDKAVRPHLPELLEGIAILVLDAESERGGEIIYATGADAAGKRRALSSSRTRELAGQRWELRFTALPAFQSRGGGPSPLVVAGLGSLISLAITAIAATLVAARAAAEAARRDLAIEVATRTDAQRQLQVANQELVHRAKNTLAVVSAIAAQTARFSPDPAEFVSAFRERLAGLGRVHDHLKSTSSIAADLRELLYEILKPYVDLRPETLSLEGPPFPIGSQEALMLSLVVNELATNAVKHGAWSIPQGHVTFSWRSTPSAGGWRVEMRWVERLGPPVQQPQRRGFGSNVLKFAIERGLRGSFATAYEAEGLTCTLSFPLSPAPGPGAQRERHLY